MKEDARRALQLQLQQLRNGFAEAIPEKMAEIDAAWARVAGGEERRSGSGEAEYQFLYRIAHSLVGNSGTFGFNDLSECARALEHALADKVPQDKLQQLIANLREAAARAMRLSPPLAEYSDFPLTDFNAAANSGQAPMVLLVDDDEFFSGELLLQLEGYGYRVKHCRTLADVPAALEREMPAALVMDIIHPEGELAGPLFLSNLINQGNTLPPTLFISVRDDLSARLEAVRAGGLGYFTKPLEMPQLIARLEVLVGYRGPEPYRILMIEDSATESTHYAHVLRRAGMQVTVVSNPLQVMEPLLTERPDLVLMDLYMPGCSGLELATVIRQQDAFMGIPIVFLSSETDVDRQMSGLSMGGDDFLEKPISPEHLVASLAARVTRARLLRANMNRDSLTGLLNHGNFKYQLKLELSRAARRQGSLALAVIDIDDFKQVNDTYGHPVGDRVIRSLTRHLQQQLRETDILGRLGGDEFGAILLDTDEEGAKGRLDSIREAFAAHHYRGLDSVSEAEPFAISFSCGVSGFPGKTNVGADPEALLVLTDQALLEAKLQGRNRIVVAGA
ncbi:MAG: diguanylate cyclase [Holophagaceae bacterium]|nr:diguanylate cyclase [Holophagaceae bacterium]